METILIIMDDPEKSHMMVDLLGSDHRIINDPSQLDEKGSQNLSLIIMDLHSWSHYKEDLQAYKEKEKTLFMPYLLVASRDDLKNVEGVWNYFDEVIHPPINKMILRSRVHVLLQTRRLSMRVNQLLQDKEMLMKEIHHRMKNNLMIISSLLSLQSNYIKDEESREIFRESQSRATSMALIHDRLYRSSDLQSIDFEDFISSLAEDLMETYSTQEDRIHLNLDVEDVDIDIDNIVPLGLIINEMLTNSLKYAFPDEMKGTISISFHKRGDEYFLEVSDDGMGIPEEFEIEKSDSLGMMLINSLTYQIGGELKLERSPGTTYHINFKDP